MSGHLGCVLSSLNCEKGCMGHMTADQSEHIHTILGSSITGQWELSIMSPKHRLQSYASHLVEPTNDCYVRNCHHIVRVTGDSGQVYKCVVCIVRYLEWSLSTGDLDAERLRLRL